MPDKFNPYESEFGPEHMEEFSVNIPISDLIEKLNKIRDSHSEHYLKKCPHCNEPVIFYKDDWFFCQKHNFVKLEV